MNVIFRDAQGPLTEDQIDCLKRHFGDFVDYNHAILYHKDPVSDIIDFVLDFINEWDKVVAIETSLSDSEMIRLARYLDKMGIVLIRQAYKKTTVPYANKEFSYYETIGCKQLIQLLKGGYSNEGHLNAFHTLGVPTLFLGTNYVDGFNYW